MTISQPSSSEGSGLRGARREPVPWASFAGRSACVARAQAGQGGPGAAGGGRRLPAAGRGARPEMPRENPGDVVDQIIRCE